MSLKQSLQIELNQLSVQGGRGTFSVSVVPGTLECEIEHLDQVGCAFQHLTLHSDRLAAAPVDQLKDLAQDLAGRVTYLLEPIGLFEIDSESCVVQLRSVPPSRHGHDASYFEVLAQKGGSVNLKRYEKKPKLPRQQVVAEVTREVLYKLSDDLVAAVEEF